MILAAHERIVRVALGDVLSPGALRRVIGANKRSDLHQFAPEYHFDSAPNSRALCDLWQRGLRIWLSAAIALARPNATGAIRPLDRRRALAHFGRATHALADFYAHTNWVELALASGASPTPAALLSASCEPARFLSGLYSGYFHLRHGLSGCPRSGPPPGFAACHARLNKDSPQRGHGAERPMPGGPTYHDIAVQLAVESTRAAWEALCSGIRAAHEDVIRAERTITQLAGQGARG